MTDASLSLAQSGVPNRAVGPSPADGRAHCRGSLIAVASGKGGVGKTWLAITLAHALALADRRVLVVDGDLGLANLDIQLGLIPVADIGAVLDGRLSVEDAVTRVEAGFDVLAGQSGSGGLAHLDSVALERLIALLHGAAMSYDVVIVDLGAGLDSAVRRLAADADGMLLLATDEPTSLTDAYAVLKLYLADRGMMERVRVVINNAANKSAGERTYATLSRACTTFLGGAPELAGIILRDEHVRDAIRRQTPLLTRHPSSQAARDVETIARLFIDG